MFFTEADIISKYTTEMGIEDGLFVDTRETEVASLATEAGIKVPVIVTSTVWEEVFKPSPAAERRGESLAGRAWDIFFMFTLAARMARGRSDLTFEVIHTNAKGRHTTAEIFATFDRMGDGSPVIKFMFPSER